MASYLGERDLGQLLKSLPKMAPVVLPLGQGIWFDIQRWELDGILVLAVGASSGTWNGESGVQPENRPTGH